MEKPTNETMIVMLTEMHRNGIDLLQVKDDKDFNLLHHAVYKGQLGKVASVITAVKSLQSPKF